jgi:hypothetical protein
MRTAVRLLANSRGRGAGREEGEQDRSLIDRLVDSARHGLGAKINQEKRGPETESKMNLAVSR